MVESNVPGTLELIKPILETLEAQIVRRYEAKIVDLEEEVARLNRVILELRSNQTPIKSSQISSACKEDAVDQYRPNTDLEVSSSSPPQETDIQQQLSPTQYSSSQTHASYVQQSQQHQFPLPLPSHHFGTVRSMGSDLKTSTGEIAKTSPKREQNGGDSYSIFHNNIGIDPDTELHMTNDCDEDEEDSPFYEDFDSFVSQRKRKFEIEDSQPDDDVVFVLKNEIDDKEAKHKRSALKDITISADNKDNIGRGYANVGPSGLNFQKSFKTVNLSQNFKANRDWNIADFKPNPALIDSQEGFFTKADQVHQPGANRVNVQQIKQCRCQNCIRFYQLAGEPLSLNREDKLQMYISRVTHGQQNNLFNFSVEAPGLGRSDFPSTQESKEDRIKAQKINKVKALMKLLQAFQKDEKTGFQNGLFVFRDQTFNELVKAGNFVIDDWVYQELDRFIDEREK